MSGDKQSELLSIMRSYGKLAVAFSGGVDSAVLAKAAKLALGDNCVAVTAYSELLPQAELIEAKALAGEIGIKHIILAIDDLNNKNFVANDAQRCYFCKKARFTALLEWAEQKQFSWIAEGSNLDDFNDYRPGMQAVNELAKVVSPLVLAGFTKREIRALAKKWLLPVWDKPSAACLASRLSYGLEITAARLKQVEQAEAFVRQYTKGQIRVRHYGSLARIEVEEPAALINAAAAINQELRQLGFMFVTVDLAGYRMGSTNAVLPEAAK